MESRRFATDKALLAISNRVRLGPARDRAVFYSEEIGRKRAADFVRRSPDHTRLDDLLARTEEGRNLLKALSPDLGRWSDIEEIWLSLSMRLAHEASGRVHCFGPDRHMRSEPVENAEHSIARGRYAHTQFEKAELPELMNNPDVDDIFFNGKLYF